MKLVLIICILSLCSSCGDHKISHYDHELIGIDDALTIRYLGDAEEAEFRMTGSKSIELDNQNSQTLEATVEIDDLDNAIFSYELITRSKNINGEYDTIKNSTNDLMYEMLYWIGENRIENYTKNKSLAGQIKDEFIDSEFLTTKRKITTYTPKENNQDTPTIIFMDGQAVNNYAPYIDKLIVDEEIHPVKLIGIHSEISSRYTEYTTSSQKNQGFEDHENFVFKEVIPMFDKGRNGNKRYLYGCSNGAAFGVYSGLNYPNLFKEIIAFSIAGYKADLPKKLTENEKDYPSFYFTFGKYGAFEKNLRNTSSLLIHELKNRNTRVEVKDLNSSHDYTAWRIEFLNYLKSRFNANSS